MADYKKLVPFILRWEGGKVNDPDDRGGLTNKGITRATFVELSQKVLGIAPTIANFNNLTSDQAAKFIKYYFDIATYNNSIKNEEIAFIITNWFWGSGRGGLIQFQKMLNSKFGTNLTVDGEIGPKTINAINSINAKLLYNEAIKWRANFFKQIAANDPSQKKFLNGWLNRLNDFVNKYPVGMGLSIGFLILTSITLYYLNK